MDVNLLTVNKSKAQEEYKAYRELVKNNRTDVDYAKDMKRLYNTIKSGRKVIDIYEAFKVTGLNEKEEPKLAIARADCKMVTFEKQTGGGGLFYSDKGYRSRYFTVYIPSKTFNPFKLVQVSNT